MPEKTPSEHQPWELTELDRELENWGNFIYQVSHRFEELERQGKLSVNGHHLRQELARYAQKLIHDGWTNQDERAAVPPTHPLHDPPRP